MGGGGEGVWEGERECGRGRRAMKTDKEMVSW